jgi:hypothetical protein
MKHVVILFLLCFHFVGKSGFAAASDHTLRNNVLAVQSSSNTKLASGTTIKDYKSTGIVGINEESAFLVNAEWEDEDENSIKKVFSSVKHFLAFSYAINSSRRYSCLAQHLSYCQRLSYTGSCKYILHRAFRI